MQCDEDETQAESKTEPKIIDYASKPRKYCEIIVFKRLFTSSSYMNE